MKNFFCKIYAFSKPLYFFAGSTVFAVALYLFDKHSEALFFTVALLATFGVVTALKFIFHAPRPSRPMVPTLGPGFPSAHAAAGGFATVVFSYLSGTVFHLPVFIVGSVFGVIALVVATSRVYLRAHTTLQAVAGLLIGILVPLVILLNQTALL